MQPRNPAQPSPSAWPPLALSALLLLCGAIQRARVSASETGPSSDARWSAGYQVAHFTGTARDGSPERTALAVWYPSTSAEAPLRYHNGRFAQGRAAISGEPALADGPFPLVLLSHGYSGSGVSYVYLSERLARHGYVVVAPDYDDEDQLARIGGRGSGDGLGALERARTLASQGQGLDHAAMRYRFATARAAIDAALALAGATGEGAHAGAARELDAGAPRLAGLADAGRIAAMGHSLGAYTSYALAGALPEAANPRVKALVALSGGVAFLDDAEVARIAVPTLIAYGEAEDRDDYPGLPREGNRQESLRAYGCLSPPKALLEIRGANHFDFGDMDSPPGRPPALRREQKRAIAERVTAFLDAYLKGDATAEERLLAPDPAVTFERHELR
jgi:predicted dienelactone hydrolase